MAQYIILTDPDTNLDIRIGTRDNKFEYQGEIDVIGFSGTEELNWESVETVTPQ